MTAATRTGSGSALRLAVLRLSRRLRQEGAGSGDVTPSQMSALSTLMQQGELTLGELAAIERVAPPSMTRIAGRLEERGLIERRPDRADRRVARVAISPAGRDLLRLTRERGDAFLTARLASLTVDERDLLDRAVPLLERLAAGYEDPEAADR